MSRLHAGAFSDGKFDTEVGAADIRIFSVRFAVCGNPDGSGSDFSREGM